MTALVLVVAGVAVLAATVMLARRTVGRLDEPDPSDPWSAFTPRSDEDIEREAKVRLWPIASFLTGIVLILGGVLVSQLPSSAPADENPAVVIEVPKSPTPEAALAEPTADPSPSASASPTASPTASPSATARPTATPRRTATPSPTSRPATPTPAPTPTPSPTPPPTPPPPGPNVGASTSCFRDGGGNTASISYSVNARENTRLASVRLLLDGEVVASPSVSGRTSYSGSFSRQVSPGPHRFTVQATQTNQGSTTRSFTVCT